MEDGEMNEQLLDKARAIALSLYPTTRELRTSHVAFLLRRNRIMHVGWNKHKTHPITSRHPYHPGQVNIHAEVDVILKSGKEDLSDYELLSVRIGEEGKFMLAKPCNGCMSVIQQFGITKIYHT